MLGSLSWLDRNGLANFFVQHPCTYICAQEAKTHALTTKRKRTYLYVSAQIFPSYLIQSQALLLSLSLIPLLALLLSHSFTPFLFGSLTLIYSLSDLLFGSSVFLPHSLSGSFSLTLAIFWLPKASTWHYKSDNPGGNVIPSIYSCWYFNVFYITL